jgi:hypothetical protein
VRKLCSCSSLLGLMAAADVHPAVTVIISTWQRVGGDQVH